MQRTLSPVRLLCAVGMSLLVSFVGSRIAFAADLDRTTIEAVSNATFEVVVLKLSDDPLTYERPLPLDLIPYAIRKDQYYSVGTAFAIGPNQWVTAAHVLDFGHKSLYKTYRLRDSRGKVYDIGEILKYSLRRDFVVFNIKDSSNVEPLATNAAPRVNDKVYAAGNALGQGIVFRDGLYTSDTEEEQDGEWKWIRFSAAASPGNSGGPLLDPQGRVIGVVLRKSANENLNFALPISEVLKARDGVAEVDTKMVYKIDNMPDMSSTDRLRKEIALPKSYTELDALVTAALDGFGVKLKDDLLAQQRDRIFPNGKESLPLLHSSYSAVMPGLVGRGADGKWDVFTPQKKDTNDIGMNGSVTYGTLGNSQFMLFQKPDEVDTGTLYKDSKMLMDLILRGDPVYRTIGAENIKVTSLGKAAEEYTHIDRYERKWLVRVWDVGYSDQQIALLALPVPGGFAGMVRMLPAGQMAGHMIDLKLLADFIYLSYYGTLDQWRDFLAQRDLLPQAFADIKLDFEYGKHFRYASKRIAFSYGPKEMHITEKSDLKLQFAYFLQKDKAVWDVAQVVVGDSKDNATSFSVLRNIQPPKQLDDKFKSTWDNIARRRHPYNKAAFFMEKSTLIGDVFARNLNAGELAQAPLLYTAFYSADGNLGQKSAETKLHRLLEKLTVVEH